MLGQVSGELGEAAGVLVLELHAGRALGIARGERRHAVPLQGLTARGSLGLEPGGLRRLGAVAATGDHQGHGSSWVAEAEVQGGEPAHGQADDMGALDAEVVEHRGDVVRGATLRVLRRVLRHGGGRVAAGVEGNRPAALAEVPQLRLPASQVAGKLVHEDDRGAGAGFLIIKRHMVVRGGVRHGCAVRRLGGGTAARWGAQPCPPSPAPSRSRCPPSSPAAPRPS